MSIFNKLEEQKIIQAIRDAELATSGEIRVHISTSKPIIPIQERALKTFDKLDMEKTKDRNGVLFYIDVKHHIFAIAGDKGIHEKVGQEFWDSTKQLMTSCFKRGDLVQGIVAGILKAGQELKQHFPYQTNDLNELPDEISYS